MPCIITEEELQDLIDREMRNCRIKGAPIVISRDNINCYAEIRLNGKRLKEKSNYKLFWKIIRMKREGTLATFFT